MDAAQPIRYTWEKSFPILPKKITKNCENSNRFCVFCICIILYGNSPTWLKITLQNENYNTFDYVRSFPAIIITAAERAKFAFENVNVRTSKYIFYNIGMMMYINVEL